MYFNIFPVVFQHACISSGNFQHVCISFFNIATAFQHFSTVPAKKAFPTEMEIVLINEDQVPGPAGFSSVTTKLLQSEYQTHQ